MYLLIIVGLLRTGLLSVYYPVAQYRCVADFRHQVTVTSAYPISDVLHFCHFHQDVFIYSSGHLIVFATVNTVVVLRDQTESPANGCLSVNVCLCVCLYVLSNNIVGRAISAQVCS